MTKGARASAGLPSDADLMAAGARRVERVGGAVLILGDCRAIAPTLPRPDAIVSDPPYGVPVMLRSDFGARGTGLLKNGRDWGELVGNGEEFDPGQWLDADTVILWGANHFAHRLPANGRWLIWDKRCGVVPERTQADCELAWCSDYGAARVFRFLWDGVCQDEKKGPRVHPTEKPEGVMAWTLRFLPPSARVVLDPYMGSGTTGVACLRRGVRFVGIEIELKYFEVACARITKASQQPDLFIHGQAEPEKPVQLPLLSEAV